MLSGSSFFVLWGRLERGHPLHHHQVALKHIGGQASACQIKGRDVDFYERLVAAGFQLDFGEDESGQGMKAVRNGSGFYIDIGASALIIAGAIKLRSGVSIERIKVRSIVLSDGSELPADLIVYTTGYHAAQSERPSWESSGLFVEAGTQLAQDRNQHQILQSINFHQSG